MIKLIYLTLLVSTLAHAYAPPKEVPCHYNWDKICEDLPKFSASERDQWQKILETDPGHAWPDAPKVHHDIQLEEFCNP